MKHDALVEAVARALNWYVPTHLIDAATRAALEAVEASGWVIVPKVPTREMAFATPDDLDGVAVEDIYAAMLSARPKQED